MNPDAWSLDMFDAAGGSHLSHDFGMHLLSQLGSLVDNSTCRAHHVYVPGNIALQEAFSCISKFAGVLFLWLSTGSCFKSTGSSKVRSSLSATQVKHIVACKQNLVGFQFGQRSKSESNTHHIFTQVSASMRHLLKELGQFRSYPMLSLAASLIPPIDNISSKILALPLEKSCEHLTKYMDHSACEDSCQNCPSISLSKLSWAPDTMEPKTGIMFPSVLYNPIVGADDFHHITEVLVGTGSRIMQIVKLKSIKLYAFGLSNELKDRADFFEDLLREDIHMTLRLVVSYNGIKISAVKEAFEKALRARLEKMSPNTEYHCLNAFGSYFSQDIPLPAGTMIDIRRTIDGQLITEIGGRHIGAVRSKDLCRAFFDMYIGEVPVSTKAKQDMAQNLGGIIGRC